MNEDKDFKAWLHKELLSRLGPNNDEYIANMLKLTFKWEQRHNPCTWTGGWYKEYNYPYYNAKPLETKKPEPSRRVINP